MNLFSVILSLLLFTGITSCNSTKQVPSEELFEATWQLTYINDAPMVFDGLFPKKPYLRFDKEAQEVRGNSGCNGYGAKYMLEGNKVSFGEPYPATKMYCGEGEAHFLKMINKVNTYVVEDKNLHLLQDDKVVMRFKKIAATQ